jgi:hypothetical protein
MISLYAVAGFAVYIAGSLWLGEFFPFSLFNMYAAIRDEGAVPVFLAEGRPAKIEEFSSFWGIDTDGMLPEGFQCSLVWEVHEAQRWIEDHRASAPVRKGVRVEWGYRMVRVEPSGELKENIKVVSKGKALRRC